ncbi:helix-turn-helix domain-containing protein [Rhizobacter sp. J219]|uniref:helix-turn-helix domain-containing protein n=1 Tax=Rhizobacter sp. J219 TaxID=2898430 RepID=UPI002150DE11|nr:helix-turn-helix domain-containing protein [Rhizobacter sp. J219]MCR5883722.1 helix-turn-helix domain-containing protein [Rhizobacter sp. J219]
MSDTKGSAAYGAFGAMVARLRVEAGFAKQQDLAVALGVKQQTISRWEKGLSRPRSADIPALANALKADEALLGKTAGYAGVRQAEIQTAIAFDRPFPLHALSPESFERFCRFLLERLYRGRGIVHPYGAQGHEQKGIDIFATGEFGVHSFQCKRVEKFGAHKVHAAVADQTFEAQLRVLLLSTTASPDARDAVAKHKGWELWDREDISYKLRTLPERDQIDLVDIFFRGHRNDLLGINEAGPFLSKEDFFKPFLADDRLFHHQWELVGRSDDERSLLGHLANEQTLLTLLVGGPGYGKTRLLREAVLQASKSQPHRAIWFASPTEEIQAKHLEQLGSKPLLIVVDDAHDREDLGVLLRHAASNTNVRLLFSLRPYGTEALKHQAATFSLSEPQVKVVRLSHLSKAEAKTLAEEVLKKEGGPIATAPSIAEATYGLPLATVLGAQVVAREKIAPLLMGNVQAFQDHVLARLQDVITGSITTGQDSARLQAVLRIVSLVQPVVPDDPNLLKLIQDAEGVPPGDSARLLRLLIEAGVLFKRGRRYRVAPDLLADSVIQRNHVGPDRKANDRAIAVFDVASPEHLKHLLVNLGRLEWRLNDGETKDGVVLESIAPKLQWRDDYVNAHVAAVEAVAYYQPRFAIEFARRLIKEGHGDSSPVCGMLRNAAYTIEFLEEACGLLWKAGRTDNRALNQHPRHGIRILKELAEFEPNKPVEVVNKVVRFALSLLERPHSLQGAYTPFAILEGALGTEMESTTATSRAYTITRYQLPLHHAKEIREEIISSLLTRVSDRDPRMGFLAATTLSEAVRGPMHTQEREVWNAAHLTTLQRLFQVLTGNQINPIVLVRAAKSVGWHAFYGPTETKPLAKKILSLLDRDLPTRLVRALIDGWGTETYRISESGRREAHEAAQTTLIADLSKACPSATEPTNTSISGFASLQKLRIRDMAPRSC